MMERRRHPDRRSYDEDPDLLGRLDQALDRADPDTREALEALRREYTIFARRNASRLATLGRKLLFAGLIVAVIQLGLGAFGLHLQVQGGDLSRANRDTLMQVQSGRHTSLSVTCAVQSAVAQAGRAVIEGSSSPPPARQEQALEGLGFPPFAVRHKQAEQAADGYVATISKRIDAQIGRKGDGLVNANGTIDCTRLAQIAKVGR